MYYNVSRVSFITLPQLILEFVDMSGWISGIIVFSEY